MKILLLAIAALVLTFEKDAAALTLFTDNFNSYSNGNLVGQGGWVETGGSTNPIQVLNGTVILPAVSGQDAYNPFAEAYSLSAGMVITSTITFSITTASSDGGHFFHLQGQNGGFYDRLYAKSAAGGYVLGMASFAGEPAYGTTVLSFNTIYTVSTIWTVVGGPLNDVFGVDVNGASYLSGVQFDGSSEPTSILAVHLRQSQGTTGAYVTVDSVSVNVNTPTPVPEPHECAVAITSLLGAIILLRHRRRNAVQRLS